MSRRILPVCVGIVLAAGSYIVLWHSTAPLALALLVHAGPSSQDCGHVALRSDGTASFQCFVAAATSGQPARVSFALQGIDSPVAVGLFSSNGSISRIDLSGPAYFEAGLPRLRQVQCASPAYAPSQTFQGVAIPVPVVACNATSAP